MVWCGLLWKKTGSSCFVLLSNDFLCLCPCVFVSDEIYLIGVLANMPVPSICSQGTCLLSGVHHGTLCLVVTEVVLEMVALAACNIERCMLSTFVSISSSDISRSMVLKKSQYALKLNMEPTGTRVRSSTKKKSSWLNNHTHMNHRWLPRCWWNRQVDSWCVTALAVYTSQTIIVKKTEFGLY